MQVIVLQINLYIAHI